MLSDRVKSILRANQLVVVIGARGTGKTRCADRLYQSWREVGLQVLKLDAAAAEKPQDLESPLAECLGCDVNHLTARFMDDDKVVRVVVDRAEYLYDRNWLSGLQERWRALLSDPESQGRLAMVFFGRPVFRQIAGGDASPLLNAGPVITPEPLTREEIEAVFGVDDACAQAVLRKTGGHPHLTALLLEAIDRDEENIGAAIGDFVRDNRRYIAQLVQDHPLESRGVLSDLLEKRSAIHQSPLIRRHFGSAHADGMESIDDLEASGLIARTEDGCCSAKADLLRNFDGLQSLLGAPAVDVPTYEPEVMGEAGRLVFAAENQLRKLVAENLSELDSTWWISQVPRELRGAAEARRDEEGELLPIEGARLHPIMYLNLGEQFDLIFMRENWERVFRTIFPGGRAAVEDGARRFGALRNRLAHNRPLSKPQLEELERVVRRLGLT